LRDDYAAFEDGTVNYLGLPAVEIGLRHIESIGIETIHARVQALTAWLLQEMSALRHANGKPLAQIYGPTTPEQRGGTIAFNLFDVEGRYFEGREVEAPAHQSGISLRSGCFCNPGAGEAALGITREQLEQCFRPGLRMTYEQLLAYMQGTHTKDTSALRISVGLASNFADVFRFVTFLRRFLDRQASAR
jgi:selenocysteine lyase/cysteine desulfurase